MSTLKYRSEIDGLRAFAVLPVILFHAGFELFKGGFVGVDIFFVISGYLITSIILSEISEDKFNIVNFYERRARRILPALFFVIIFSLPLSWFIFSPMHIKEFGESLISVTFFVSNFFFWRESGYFDSAVELKPLIHTWSLAIEEQFYIFFPVFMSMTWFLGIKRILIVLFLVFSISLIAANWGAYNYSSATFYLLPTRVWELLIGVFCAFYLSYKSFSKNLSLNQLLSMLGFSMIMYSIIVFDENTPFPSFYSLIPTIGTALLILSAIKNTFIHSLLSQKIFVGIGLISYSAYLFHQPVLAYTRYALLDQISNLQLILSCSLAIMLAWFSWRYIEKPFRDKKKTSRSFIFKSSFAGIIIISSIGYYLHLTNGLEDLKIKYQYSESDLINYQIVRESTDYDMYEYMNSSNCNIWVRDTSQLESNEIDLCYGKYGSPHIVVGDSHAMNIYNIFSKSGQFEFLIGVSQGACEISDSSNCHYQNFIEFLENKKYLKPLIVYHQTGSHFLIGEHGNPEKDLAKSLSFDPERTKEVISYLNETSELVPKVIWLGSFTEYRIDPKLRPNQIFEIPSINFEVFDRLDKEITNILPKNTKFHYIPFNEFFDIPRQTLIEGCLIWRDGDHFSRCGEDHIASKNGWQTLFKM